jgi:hypothetical protein
MPKPARRSPHPNAENLEVEFGWLATYGLDRPEIGRLLPTVPGTLTSPRCFYVNSMLPKHIFRGREQGSLPLTAGRWFLIPLEIVRAFPKLWESTLPPAAAVSKLGNDGPTTMAAWTAGG